MALRTGLSRSGVFTYAATRGTRPNCAYRTFHAQRDTPIVPQARVRDGEGDQAASEKINVGYLLLRQPVVKPDPHPLEHEWSFLLDREHNRYARHTEESATAFFAARGLSIDSWGRQDPKQIQGNYYSMESYQDASATVARRYHPAPRLQKADFVDPFAPELSHGPPARHTLNRRLSDYLMLIVKFKATGLWGIPYGEREPQESLRLTLDRVTVQHHGDLFDTYTPANAPHAVIKMPSPVASAAITAGGEVSTNDNAKTSASASSENLFVFTSTYLSGRPTLTGLMAPIAVSDHAWVTRSELIQYDFVGGAPMVEVLRDIAPDAYFETP